MRAVVAIAVMTWLAGCNVAEPPSSAVPYARPRPITLEVPWEHMAVSGGVDSFVGRNHDDALAFAGPGQAPLKIFLNRFGGTYRPGPDDSRANTSIVPTATSTIPAFDLGDAAWDDVVACVTDQFARFNVTIVDDEPAANERYVEHVVGGLPNDVGLPSGVGGVAPIDNFNCRVLDTAINFTFAEVYGGNTQAICETAAQEIAHSFSLDHELFCPDPMTYLGGCGDKSFRDSSQQCGEFQPRACNCNRASQNSVQILFDKLGAVGDDGGDPTPTEQVPPTVSINAPANGAVLQQDSTITISATATDNVAIASTQLVWDFTGNVFDCPTNFGGGAVTCTRTGNVSTWNLLVSQGSRTFSVRATDTSGNVSETAKRTVGLGDGGAVTPTPTDTTPPTASVSAPADGQVLPANTTMQVVATANDDLQLASVELLWSFTGDVFPCPFSGQAVTCTQAGNVFTWVVNVGVGLRAFQVRAIDTAGQQVVTPARTIELSTDGAVNPGDPDTVGEENDSSADAFAIRCGNALDLVVAADDEDWFAIDAPADTAVQVGISSTTGATVGLELFTADGQTQLAADDDIAGGALRGVSAGPAVLARVTTTTAATTYRLTATCSAPGGDIPTTGEDDALEDNDTADTPTRTFCGQQRNQLVAADLDFHIVEVREGDVMSVTVGEGVVATVFGDDGTALSATARSTTATNLPAGDVLVRIEPERPGRPRYYDLDVTCSEPSTVGGCGCNSTSDVGVAIAGVVLLGLARRRRRA
jgi:MYXO-CTERM domain-containing protein